MKPGLIALAVLLAAACGKTDLEFADYTAPDRSFSARLPADWKVDDVPGETRRAAFYGPPKGAKPFSQLMGVYFHAAVDPAAEARAYLASAQDGTTPIRDVKVGAASGLEATAKRSLSARHLGPEKVVTRTVVVIFSSGFFSLEHTWPADSEPSPAFDQLVGSFVSASPAK